MKPTPPAWSPVVVEQQVFAVHGIDVQKDTDDADVPRRFSTRPTTLTSLGSFNRDSEGANESIDQDRKYPSMPSKILCLTRYPYCLDTTSRSSTTVYASPLPGTSAASSPMAVQPASRRGTSPSPTGQVMSSGYRKRSVATEDEGDVPQKRFKGSEGEFVYSG